jgi:hypothetical protein
MKRSAREIAILFTITVACATYSVTPPVEVEAADAGSDASSASQDVAPPPKKILYVAPSPSGLPTNDGLSTARPIDTVGGAIAYASSKGLQGYEIHICRGVYAEAGLVLRYGVSIRGGYNCATWERAPGFGYAGDFKDDNTTTIGLVDSAAEYALSVADLQETILIDGLTLIAPRAVTSANRQALRVSNSVIRVEDNVVRGGDGVSLSTEVASMAMLLEGGAPKVRRNRLYGGSGETSVGAYGSVAVRIAKGSAAVVEQNDIDAGSGRGTYFGAVGVETFPIEPELADLPTLRNNRITQSGGRAEGGVPATLFLGQSSAIAEGNRFLNGQVQTGGTLLAAYLTRGIKHRFVANRIDAGSFGGVAQGRVTGVQLNPEAGALIANNLVVLPALVSPSSYAQGMVLQGRSVILAHNTFVAHEGTRGVSFSLASLSSVYANLFVNDAAAAIATEIESCNGFPAGFSRLAENVTLGTGVWRVQQEQRFGFPPQTYCFPFNLADEPFNARYMGVNNRSIASMNLADNFEQWPALLSTGLTTNAFAPRSSMCMPLVVSRIPEVTTDIDGKPRSVMTVAGAFQPTCP